MKTVVAREGTVIVEDGGSSPAPGPGQLLIAMRATGLNGADHYMKLNRYPSFDGKDAKRQLPGLEFAGTVLAVGPDAGDFYVGEAVMGLTTSGAHSEFIIVDHRTCAPVPSGMDWCTAGSFSEMFTAAHDALVSQGELNAGDRLLVTGASGGVGTAAVQVGSHLGAEVDAIARSSALHEALRALGATTVMTDVDHSIREQYDVILELVTGENMTQHLNALRLNGRIVVVGCAAHPRAEFNLLKLMAKRGALSGSTLRSRPVEQKREAFMRMLADIVPGVTDGKITVPIHSRHRLEDAVQAYESFSMPGKFGKVVIVDDETPPDKLSDRPSPLKQSNSN